MVWIVNLKIKTSSEFVATICEYAFLFLWNADILLRMMVQRIQLVGWRSQRFEDDCSKGW